MDNATYNAWMWQQHLAAAAQRKATATMSMTVTDHHTATTTMDDATDDSVQACIARALARTTAMLEARNNALAASATARGPTATLLAADTTARDPHLIVVPSYNPTDKFAPVQAPVVPSATSTPPCPTTRPEQHSPWDSTLHTDYETVEDEAPQDGAICVTGLPVDLLTGTCDDPTKAIGDVGDTSTSLVSFTAKNFPPNEQPDELVDSITTINIGDLPCTINNEFMIDQSKAAIDGSNSDEHTARFEDENKQSTQGWADMIEEKSPPPTPTDFNAETAETTARKTAERPPRSTRLRGDAIEKSKEGKSDLDNDEDLSENVDSMLAMSATTSANIINDTFAFDELNDTNENEDDKLVFIVDTPVNDEDDSSKCITRLQDEKDLDTEEWTTIIEDYHSTDWNDEVVTMGDGMQLQAQYVLCKKILECLYQWDNLTPAIVKYPTELDTLTPSNGPTAGIQLGASEYDANIYSYTDEAMNGPCNLPVFNSFTDEPMTRVVSY